MIPVAEPTAVKPKPARDTRNRYTSSNPPPDEETALNRIDVLSGDIESTRAQLEVKEPDDFSTDEEYDRWRKSASSALSYTREEWGFLKSWVKRFEIARRRERGEPDKPDYNIERLARLEKTQPEIDRISAIKDEYQTVYSKTSSPVTIKEAEERLEDLESLKQRIRLAFSEIAVICHKEELGKGTIAISKASLEQVFYKIETELRVVRRFLHVHHEDNSPWFKTCISALDRVVQEGFVLTEEEAHILAEFHKRNS